MCCLTCADYVCYMPELLAKVMWRLMLRYETTFLTKAIS